MDAYQLTIPPFKKFLQHIELWLDQAIAFAAAKKFDPNTLLTARLAPDQFPLARQIQSSCDQAKFTVARLTGKAPPAHPDTETTIEELKKRVHAVMTYLDGFTPADFDGSENRLIELPNLPAGKAIVGLDYLVERQLPNFFFHLTTTYAILRHNGVPLGKADFLGRQTLRDR